MMNLWQEGGANPCNIVLFSSPGAPTFEPPRSGVREGVVRNPWLGSSLSVSTKWSKKDARRPDEVVRPDRRKATVLWIILIISILSYSAYLFLQVDVKRQNPSTSFELSNDIYEYPDVWVCLYDYYGCDDSAWEEQCAASMDTTEGGTTQATYYPEGEDEQGINVTAGITDTKGWCIQFETSSVTRGLGEERDSTDYLNYILFDLYWYPGGDENSSTCITEEGEWEDHSESIFVYLHDPEEGSVSTGIQVPYTCITNESSSYIFTYVGIGLTVVNGIGGTEVASYKALSTSSSAYKFKTNEAVSGIQRPYAHLAMELEQEQNSLQKITEIDPLDVAEILGSVGGFWDLLLIVWPLFFVAIVPTSASMRMRNLKDVVQGAEMVKSSIVTRIPSARRNSVAEADEESPPWGRSEPSSQVLIRLFDDHELVAVINGDPLKKFLKRVLKATLLKTGASEPGLQKLLPANTYVVVVPPRSGTTAIATAVRDCCARGGDASEEEDSQPIPVKVKRAKLSVLQSHALSSSMYVEPSAEIWAESDVVMSPVPCMWTALQSTSPTTNRLVPISIPKPAERPYSGGKKPVPSSSPAVRDAPLSR